MIGSPSSRGATASAMTSGPDGLTVQRTDQRTASFVLVTDRLPTRTGTGAPVGASGLVDDAVTGALVDLAVSLSGQWIGRRGLCPPEQWQTGLADGGLIGDDLEAYERIVETTVQPVYRDLVTPWTSDARWGLGYRRVNLAYARAVAARAATGGIVWVNDFRLQLVPLLIRISRPDLRVGFFLDTAFPPPDLFRHMPVWRDILDGLLAADHIGFQTTGSAENFLNLAADVGAAVPTVAVHPTSIETTRITECSRLPSAVRAAGAIRTGLGSPAKVVLSISPADSAQGIEQRLETIEHLYENGRLRPEETVVVQVVTTGTGRGEVVDGISQRAARINGRYATVGRPCVHLVLDDPDLAGRVALYRAADLMLSTPLWEASTLPALEFVAAGSPTAALLLSEFSGTAEMLAGAHLVNPHDQHATGEAIVRALTATKAERASRMTTMKTYPHAYEAHHWADNMLLNISTSAPSRVRTVRSSRVTWTPRKQGGTGVRRPAGPDRRRAVPR